VNSVSTVAVLGQSRHERNSKDHQKHHKMDLTKRILRISVNCVTFIQTDTASIILHNTHSILMTKVDFDRLQAEIENSDTASESRSILIFDRANR
jgi:hypothetical protein